jgi:hypothetical protein
VSTGIQWTDALPVARDVALAAESLNVEPVAALVAQVMMVLLGRSAAIKTRQRGWGDEHSSPYRGPNGVRRSVLNFLRRSLYLPLLSNLDTPAVNAGRRMSIRSTGIKIETDSVAPYLTETAALLTGHLQCDVGVHINSELRGRAFQQAVSRIHRGTTIPLGWTLG